MLINLFNNFFAEKLNYVFALMCVNYNYRYRDKAIEFEKLNSIDKYRYWNKRAGRSFSTILNTIRY
jgi:hypothetical protein